MSTDSPIISTRPKAPRGPRVRVATQSIVRTLDKFEQRLKIIGYSNAVVWGAFSFLLILLAWMWLDVLLDLPPLLRLFAWLSAFAGTGYLTIKMLMTIRHQADQSQLAERLDVVAKTGGQIRSGYDLWSWKRKHKDANAITLSLAELAVQSASRTAARVSEEEAYPAKPLIKSLLSMTGLLCFVFIVVLIVPRMAKTEVTRFFLPYGDQPAWSQYHFVVSPEDTEVIYSEDLEFEVEVYGPGVENLELVLIPVASKRTGAIEDVDPLDVLPMFPDHEGIWHASIANITDPFDYFLRVRRARSRPYEVRVITVPEIRDVEVEITPPIYTGQAPYRGSIPNGEIAGLAGSQVRLTITSNRPLSGGQIKRFLNDKEDFLAMNREDDSRKVTGTFEIQEPGRIELVISDELQQDSITQHSISLTLIEDQHPIIRLTQPQMISFATPSVSLPVIISAEDDYGIRRCQLYRSLNDSRFLPTDLQLPEGVPRRLELQEYLPLQQYGLQPGDVIKLFARVEDNDPHGPEPGIGKGTETPIAVVRIISDEALNSLQQKRAGMDMLMNKYQQADRRLENLAEQLKELSRKVDQLPPESMAAKELQDEMRKLAEEIKKEAELIKKLNEQKLPFDIDKQLSPQLHEMAETLEKMSQEIKEAAEDEELSKEQLQQMIKQQQEILQNEQQKHDEERMQALERLKQALPLKQDQQAIQKLTQRQRNLADRLSSLQDYEGHNDPAKKARLRELEEEQRDLRNQLTDLTDKIEEDAAKLGDDEEMNKLRDMALDFAKALRESGASESMIDAEEGMGQFSGSKGHSAAEKAAEALEKLAGQGQQMGDQAGDSLSGENPGLEESLRKSMNQLAPGSPNKPGQGQGTGSGEGESSQMDSMKNVGMYGGNPLMEPTESKFGSSDQNSQTATSPGIMSDEAGADGGGFKASQSNPAYGGAEWGVPLKYQRQSGRYLQKLAEELEE